MATRASAVYEMVLADKSAGGRNSFLSGLDKIDKRAAALAVGGVAALGVAGAVAFTAMYNAQAPLIDQLGKLSEKLDVGVVSLQAMQDAGDRAGLSFGTIEKSLLKMTTGISEATTGTGAAAQAIAELGLNVEELNALSPDEQFKKISDSLAEVGNRNDQLRLAEDFFGARGTSLIRLTSDAINEAEQEMRELGIALQEVDVAAVEELNDTFQRMQRNVDATQKVFVGAMAPAIQAVIDTVFDLDKSGIDVRSTFLDFADSSVTVIGFVGDRINDIRRTIIALEFGLQQAITGTLRLADLAPGVDLGDKIAASFEKGIDIYAQYLELDENGKFSERLRDNFAAARENAEAAARAFEDRPALPAIPEIPSITGTSVLDNTGDSANDSSATDPDAEVKKALERRAAETKAREEAQQAEDLANLERLRESFLSEDQLLLERYQNQADILDAIAERDLSRTEEVNALKLESNDAYLNASTELYARQTAEQDRLDQAREDSARSYLDQGLSYFASKSEAADALHKALVARRMFREGREAVIGAYKWGNSIGGPALGAVLAGLAGAYTAALIAETVGGSGGSVAAAPTADVENDSGAFSSSASTAAQTEAQQNVNITYYAARGQSRSSAESDARQQFQDDLDAKRIVVGDNIDVTVNVFDYEEFGT